MFFFFHLLEHEAHAASTDTTSITTFRPSKKRGRGERERGGERGEEEGEREGRERREGGREGSGERQREGERKERQAEREGGSERVCLTGYYY